MTATSDTLNNGVPTVDLVLSGQSCVGKTTLAKLLATRGWHLFTAREAIVANAHGKGLDRSQLQALGAELEARRPGRWLVEAAASAPNPLVLDAVRTPSQIREARRQFGELLHVHLGASRDVRRERFSERADRIDDAVSFESLADSALEREAANLAAVADLVLCTDHLDPEQLLMKVLSALSRQS
jgi:cytidylate kinase